MPQLFRYFGDTTLALNAASRALIVLDGDGNTVRTMAIPKQQDFGGLVGFIHIPGIDPKGRLVYQGTLPRPPGGDRRARQESRANASSMKTPYHPVFSTSTRDSIDVVCTARRSPHSATVVLSVP